MKVRADSQITRHRIRRQEVRQPDSKNARQQECQAARMPCSQPDIQVASLTAARSPNSENTNDKIDQEVGRRRSNKVQNRHY